MWRKWKRSTCPSVITTNMRAAQWSAGQTGCSGQPQNVNGRIDFFYLPLFNFTKRSHSFTQHWFIYLRCTLLVIYDSHHRFPPLSDTFLSVRCEQNPSSPSLCAGVGPVWLLTLILSVIMLTSLLETEAKPAGNRLQEPVQEHHFHKIEGLPSVGACGMFLEMDDFFFFILPIDV